MDFYRQYDEDGEETAEDISVDTTSQPDKLYFRAVLYDALHEAYDNLTYREQRTVAKHLGFCDTCWSVRKAVLILPSVPNRTREPPFRFSFLKTLWYCWNKETPQKCTGTSAEFFAICPTSKF